MKIYIRWDLIIALLFLTGCGVKPEPIAFGKDHCAYCKMSIVDPKFGAELVTNKGKVYKFDALECMMPFMEEQQGEYAFILGVAYDEPEQLVPVDSLQFVISEAYNSPMGANLAGFRHAVSLNEGQELLDWYGLKLYLTKSK